MITQKSRTIEIAPHPSVLIESMRDIGYSLETALADVIDNSITAGARVINLFVDTDEAHRRIAIVDDGSGMTADVLLEAMRLGSRTPLEDRPNSDLGRFGLGLKTASFSQCRRLTVVTKRDGETTAARWDLDLVSQTNQWLVQVLDDVADVPWIECINEQGTLILWENLDRLVNQDGSDMGNIDFIQRIDEAREHLELVFHRFLFGEPGQEKIEILLNNLKLEPFDPFYSQHSATIRGPLEPIKVGAHEVTFQSFTLPHHRKVTPSEWNRYAGREGYVKSQGFYVYRERRLIIHGTWFRLARQSELTKLARVRIDMPNGLDSEWKIDVKKSSAELPMQVKTRLRLLVDHICSTSKRIYTARGRRLVDQNPLPIWTRFQDKNQIRYRTNGEHPVFQEFALRLPDDLRGDFSNILELIGSTLPMETLFADLGGDPGTVSENDTEEEALRSAVVATYTHLKQTLSHEVIKTMMQAAQPFRSQWEPTLEIIDHLAAQGEQDV